MPQNTPAPRGNAVELHEETQRICDRLTRAYDLMQEAVKRKQTNSQCPPSSGQHE